MTDEDKILFRDAQIVSVPENDVYEPDLVYIGDDEEEPRVSPGIIAIKTESKDEKVIRRRSSTPVNGEAAENENPISIKVTPMEIDEEVATQKTYETKLYSICTVDNEFPSSIKTEPEEDCRIEEQEQFEIVEEENAEKDTSTSSNDSTRANKSNESNDHSYSQPLQSNTTFSDDIVKGILVDTNLTDNQNAYRLLREYTNFFENFLFSEDQDSQLALYIKQIKKSIESVEKNLWASQEEAAKKDITTPLLENGTSSSSSSPKDVNMNADNEDVPMNGVANGESVATQEGLDSVGTVNEVIQVKQEVVETNTGTVIESRETTRIDEEAEKLKVYVKRVQEKTADFREENLNLLESVFVTDEDIENGNSKFKASLYNFISFNVGVLMDIENKTEHTSVQDEIDKIKADVSKARRRRISSDSSRGSIDGKRRIRTSVDRANTPTSEKKTKSRKSSVNSKESSDSDSDSSISRLTNLKTLDQRARKNEKTQISQGKQPASPKPEKVKKQKKKRGSDDENSLDTDISTGSESEGPREKEPIDTNEEPTSEDEELKHKQKIEMFARSNLLASSDDEDGSEKSYVTSVTSDFSSDDERNEKKSSSKKKQEVSEEMTDNELNVEPKESVETVSTTSDMNGEKKEEEEEQAAPLEKSVKEEKPSQPQNTLEKKAKKRQRSSFEREVFNKSLLLDTDEDEKMSDSDNLASPKSSEAKKRRKESIEVSKASNEASSSDVVDLTQLIEIKADRKAPTLEKYLEKLSSVNVDLIAEEPTSSTAANIKTDSSPKKGENKSKAPSPDIDDIDCISISSESDSEISSTISEGTTRRRKQLTEEELKEETKRAKKEETERVKRLEAKELRLSEYITQRLSQSEVIAADELVLDYSEEKDISVIVDERLVEKLKDHQIDGIKFMYNNCYGSIDDAKENNGSGCILAHCMGLGKTLQLIALTHTVSRYPQLHTRRVLIICPKSTIHNWADEFRKWLNGVDDKPAVYYLEDNLKIEKRIDKLREWYECKRPSVFLINYESFRVLVHWSGSHKRKITLPEETIKKYKQQISKYLLDPGPNLVVCDEGHIIKNPQGATNRAITKVKTKRRIILTGTPVQNALHEYYAMVEWIKPSILGTIQEFNNIYANPIKDGQNKDSTSHQIKKMKQKSYVLNKFLSKFVQRKDAQVLKEFLPKKYEYCISVPLTKIQGKLYNHFLEENRSGEMGRHLLPIYTGLRKIWTHPIVLQYAFERARRGEHKFGIQKDNQKKIGNKNAFNEDDEEPDDIFDTSQGRTAVTNNWWNSMVNDQEMYSILSSHKMILLFEILRLCELKKEKVLIFSSFVAVLDIIERFMKAIHNQANNPNAQLYGLDKHKATWEVGKDYFRLDGSTPRNVRSEMINAFNNSPSSRLRCFLISAKAGGQGINLVAANRCIIVDTSWNPANDNQNIFRIFRLGQKKTCYVYRLVACSTMEERVYSRSVTKEAMSHRVVEKKQIDRHYVRTELEELFVPYEPKAVEKTLNFPDDDILRYLLHAHPESASNYHEHDSLLENKPDQDLNEDEKKEAWDAYMAELQGNRNHLQNMNNMYGNMVNNPNLALFGKSPMSSDFLKLYNDMMGTTSNYAGLSAMLPSTSLAGLAADPLGLNSSYFPLTSSFYNQDFLKRFGNYDPLSSLYSSSSLPPTSSTSSVIHPTSTSPLMQPLRNSHNPISALGNMAAPSTSSPTAYNANNIPLASNSIFAQPTTSSSNAKQSTLPNTVPSKSAIPNKPKRKLIDDNVLSAMIKDHSKVLVGKNTQVVPAGALNRAALLGAGKDPLITPPNSSENMSILPDDHTPASSPKPGTSARTHQVPARNDRIVLPNNTPMKVIDPRSLIRPNSATKQTNGSSPRFSASNARAKPTATTLKRSHPAMFSPGPSTQAASLPLNLPKPSVANNNNNNKKNSLPASASKSNWTPPQKSLGSSVVLSPANSNNSNTPQNKQGPVISQVSGNDSVSIIRLPSKTTNQQLANKLAAASTSITPVTLKAQPAAPKMPQNISRIVQNQQKKIIDKETMQTLKRISLSQNQSSQQLNLSRQSPQAAAQRLPQQNLQRTNTSPVSQRAISQLQNLNPRTKPSSQQHNKNLPSEVVEVDD